MAPILIVVAVVLALGVVKCWSIARRPSANTKCVLSLLLVLSAWLVSVLLRAATNLDLFDRSELAGVVGLFFLVLLVVAATLAILGLVEIRGKPRQQVQGRGQAVWTLILVTLVLGLVVVGRLAGRQSKIPDHLRTEQPAQGEVISLQEFNCELVTPGAPWVRVAAEKLNADAELAFIRTRPAVFFIFIPERLGIDSGITTDTLADLAEAQMKSSASSATPGEWTSETASGIAGVQASSTVVIEGKRIIFDHWVAVRGGFGYQLVCWASARQCTRDELEETARDMRRNFRLIDPDLVIHTAGEPAPEQRVSQRFGYSLRLGADWFSWDTLSEDWPHAEFGVLGRDCALVVFPVALLGLRTDTSQIAYGLLPCLSVDRNSTQLSSPRKMSRAGFEGVEFSYRAEHDDGHTYDYRIRVLAGEHMAFLVAAWVKSGARPVDDLDRWVDGFEPEPEFIPPPAAQLSEVERRRQSHLFHHIGQALAEAERAVDAIAFLELAVQWDPKPEDHYFALLNAQLAANRYDDAIRTAESAAEFHPDNQAIRSYRPYARAHIGQKTEAIAEFEELFRSGYRDYSDLEFCADLMFDASRGDEAVQLVEHVHADDDSTQARILLARLLARQNNLERAIAELSDERARRPFDVELEWAWIETLRGASREREVRDHVQKLIERGQDSVRAYWTKADAERSLGWYRKAKETLQKGLERHGTNADIRGLLDHVNGLLGEGSNELVREVIEPVSIPARLLESAGGPALERDNHDAVYLNRVDAYHFQKGEPLRRTKYTKAVVLTPEGVSRFSSFHFSFDPLAESIHVNRVVVSDGDGKVVATGKLSDYYVLDDPSNTLASQDKQLQIPIPGLAPGHTVEVMVTLRDFAASDVMQFADVVLSTSYPMAKSSVVVTGDVGEVAHVASAGVELEVADTSLIWTVVQPTKFVGEPDRAEYQTFLPMVRLGSSTPEWATLGRQYLERLRDRLARDTAAEQAAAKETSGIEAPDGKTIALARFVQGLLTYKAIEFGSRAQIPNTAKEILEDRYGDCKDHALLLHQLLGAAGIRSSLALVNVDAPVIEELPSLDQFDHMVVYCPDYNGGQFFDCTDKYVDQNIPVPIGLGGKRALVLADDGPELVTLPPFAAEASRIESQREITLGVDGGALVRESITYHGYYASFLRGYLAGANADGRALRMQRDLSRVLPGAVVSSLKIDHLSEVHEPLVLNYEYAVTTVLQPSDDRLVGRIPAGWPRYYVALDHLERRETPFRLWYPVEWRGSVSVKPPDGYRFDSVESEPTVRHAHLLAECETRVKWQPSGVDMHYTFTRAAGQFEAQKYAELSRFLNKALAALEFGFALVR